MKFEKVAEDGDVEVLQAMTVVEGEPKENGDPVSMSTPVGVTSIDEVSVKRVLKALSNRTIEALSITKTSVTARVTRPRCSGCGEPVDVANRFCPACGTEL